VISNASKETSVSNDRRDYCI